MAQNVTIAGRQYSAVPAIDVPKTGGGTATFTDVTDTTRIADDVRQGKYFFTASGVLTLGTATGGGGGGRITQDADGYLVLDDQGGGGSAVIDPLTVTSNGTYTASGGVDGYSPVTVNVSGGGGGSAWTLVNSGEVTANTTSTTTTVLGTVAAGRSIVTSAKIIYVRIRDKAGKRNGYFYGSDNYYYWPNTANNWGSGGKISLPVNSRGNFNIYWCGNTAIYGVMVSTVKTDGSVELSTRYNSTYSGTINGTFTVEIYTLEWPDNVSPFV